MGEQWSQSRSWTRNRKLSDEAVLALQFIGENRHDDEVTIGVLETLGLARKAEQVWAERMSAWIAAERGGHVAPGLTSAETLAVVFDVRPRIVQYIWKGRYWQK